MAKEISAAKQRVLDRMKKSKSKGGGGDFQNTSIFKSGADVKFWNPKKGEEHWIDIVEYIAGPNDPDADEGEYTHCFQPYMHRVVGPQDKNVVCLAQTYAKKCPICEHVKQLIADGGDEELIDDLKVQVNPRAIYNVWVRDGGKEEKEGVQIFHASHFTMERHLAALATKPTRPGKKKVEGFIPFSLPTAEDGKTVYFKRISDFEFLSHAFEDRDEDIPQKIMKQAQCLDEMIIIPTYDEAYACLHGEDLDEDPDETPEKKSSKKETEKEVEKEVEKEESLEDKLKKMDRDGLKDYIKEEKLGIRVKASLDEEDIVALILEKVNPEPEPEEDNKEGDDCPLGLVFGKDNDSDSDICDECSMDVWNACSKEQMEKWSDD